MLPDSSILVASVDSMEIKLGKEGGKK